MKKRLAIFDMDGTLQDSSPALAGAINYVRKQLGLSDMEPEKIVKEINNPDLNPAKFFYNTDKITHKHEEWFRNYYTKNHTKEIRLYDGIKKLLEDLKSKNCLLAVATNAYKVSTMESLKHLGIDKYFDVVVSYDDVKRGKPAPDMLLKILDILQVKAKEALFIGDGERDRLASESAGIDFILVNWGFTPSKEGINSILELRERLKRAGCG